MNLRKELWLNAEKIYTELHRDLHRVARRFYTELHGGNTELHRVSKKSCQLPTPNSQLPTFSTSYFLLPTSYFQLPTSYFLLPHLSTLRMPARRAFQASFLIYEAFGVACFTFGTGFYGCSIGDILSEGSFHTGGPGVDGIIVESEGAYQVNDIFYGHTETQHA